MKSMRCAYTVRLKLQLCIIFIPYQVVLANSETSFLMLNIKNALCRFFFILLFIRRTCYAYLLFSTGGTLYRDRTAYNRKAAYDSKVLNCGCVLFLGHFKQEEVCSCFCDHLEGF